MRFDCRSALILTMVLATPLCAAVAGAPAAAAEAAGTLTERSLTVGGLRRSYLVYVPVKARDAGRPAPLVIALHGGRGLARRFARTKGFNALADAEGFVVAYPQGFGRNWNDGRERRVSPAHVQDIDDVGFLAALIVDVAGTAAIDRRRVFVTGISNGGMMALRMACQGSRHVSAVAAVAANLPERMRFRCRPARPVSVMLINGTNDPLVPWRGGEVRFRLLRLGKVLSTARTIAFWADRNGCDEAPRITDLPDADPGDGTEVRRHVHNNCEAGTEVVLYGVERGGHTWPGSVQFLPEALVGKTSRDIDATRVIWRFFKRQRPR